MTNIPEAKYYVKNDNTLGFVYAEQPDLFNVLSGNIHGDSWRDGFVHISSLDVLKPATLEDFDRFRCHAPKYFIPQSA